MFGPSSLEAEDNILRLDRTLANLLAFVDEHVGLDNTLVVLSADHGGPDTPGYLASLGISAGYVDPDNWDKAAAIDRIKSEFGIEGELGDEIRVKGHPETARILEIDYENHTLMLDRSLSWEQGDGVHLGFQGEAPDVGAFEHEPAGL